MYFDRYDILSAYYLFGSLYHSGQDSKEYAYMGRAERCGFRPGPMFDYKSLTDNGWEIYDSLVEKAGGLHLYSGKVILVKNCPDCNG